jgi:hypothetical protein
MALPFPKFRVNPNDFQGEFLYETAENKMNNYNR